MPLVAMHCNGDLGIHIHYEVLNIDNVCKY